MQTAPTAANYRDNDAELVLGAAITSNFRGDLAVNSAVHAHDDVRSLMTPTRQILRRYTDLPALLYLLSNRRITLLYPTSWHHTNDAYYLLKYKEKKNLKTVLALCLTADDETYHHWRIFSHGSSGVCISFDRAALLGALKRVPGMTSREVGYLRVGEARTRGALSH